MSQQVWEVDPLLCPQCHHEVRIVSLINDTQIVARAQLVIEPLAWRSDAWTMTAIRRSGSCDTRDLKARR